MFKQAADNSMPPTIRKYVRGYVRTQRRRRFYAAVGFAISVACLAAVLICAADRLHPLTPRGRDGFLIGSAVVVLGILIGPLFAMLFGRIPWVDAAVKIERREPAFQQRLVTVVSESLNPPAVRCSAELLARLTDAVQEQIARRSAASLVSWRRVVRAWGIALLLLGGAAALWKAPQLKLPQQIGRMYQPLAPRPGAVISPESPMTSIAAVAASQPAIAPPRVAIGAQVFYPAYMSRVTAAVDVDRVIAAPIGSEVIFSIAADQPLADAILKNGGQAVASLAAGDGRMRVAKVAVTADATYRVEVTVAGAAAALDVGKSLEIAATPDRPPEVALQPPRGGSVFGRSDVLKFGLSSQDDFAVTKLEAEVTINAAATGGNRSLRMAVPPPAKPDDSLKLELARLNVCAGDVITIAVSARDGAGHVTTSAPQKFVVGPGTAPAVAKLPIAALTSAQSSADAAAKALDAAIAHCDALTAAADERQKLAARAQLWRSLAGADGEAKTLLTKLLRVASLSGADAAGAVESLADATGGLIDDVEEYRDRLGLTTPMGEPEKANLQRLAAAAHSIHAQLTTLLQGARAATLQAMLHPRVAAARAVMRQDVLAMNAAKAAAKARAAIITAHAQELGVDPAGDVANAVIPLVAAGEKLVHETVATDPLQVAQQWAAMVTANPADAARLLRRLATKARTAGDARAADVQLAAAAAAKIGARSSASTSPTTAPADPQLANYSAAIASLSELYRTAGDIGPAAQPAHTAARAEEARKSLLSLAGNPAPAKASDVALAPPAGAALTPATQPRLDQVPPAYRDAVTAYFQVINAPPAPAPASK